MGQCSGVIAVKDVHRRSGLPAEGFPEFPGWQGVKPGEESGVVGALEGDRQAGRDIIEPRLLVDAGQGKQPVERKAEEQEAPQHGLAQELCKLKPE